MRILSDETAITSCQNDVRAVFTERAVESRLVSIGFPGGSLEGTVHWLPDLEIWGSFELEKSRHWNAFGLGNPFDHKGNVPISIEVNPPLSGINRRVQGAYAVDESGRRYLLHRGKIGGTKVGISRADFLAAFRTYGAVRNVSEGETDAEFAVVGIIDDEGFPQQAAAFVRFAERYKHKPLGIEPPAGATGSYTPEYVGTKPLPPRESVLADCRHGVIVDALHRHLQAAGVPSWNDRIIDLATGTPDSPTAVFEAKTTGDRQDLYTAVGQLTLHASPHADPIKVLVMPNSLSPSLRLAAERSGFVVVLFDWGDPEPEFGGLQDVVAILKRKNGA